MGLAANGPYQWTPNCVRSLRNSLAHHQSLGRRVLWLVVALQTLISRDGWPELRHEDSRFLFLGLVPRVGGRVEGARGEDDLTWDIPWCITS
jgi:hypothetical protein